MDDAKKSSEIGMRRGRLLANLSQQKQLDVIADGLPILMKSAGDLLWASKALGEHHRAAAILEGHATEEVAKILILMDIVRCPPKLRPTRIGPMMGWFYDHLARLIDADAQTWKPIDTKQLQEYVDHHRRSHYLEGRIGEYIMPNLTAFLRESRLYADLFTDEGGEPMWNEPVGTSTGEPLPWQVCEALQDMGAFTREGLDIVSLVWSQTDFVDDQDREDADRLTYEMLRELYNAKIITAAAREEQSSALYNWWQQPMYRIDFKMIEAPLPELQAERDARLWAESGYW